MSAAFIIDCSATMTWCFKDEATPLTLALLDRLQNEDALVPALWFLEVSNVLALAERKKRISGADAALFVASLQTLQLEVDDAAPMRALTDLLPLCHAHGLTAYDAVYLDLAIRRQIPLATLDDRLRAAAARSGIQLLGQ